MVMHLRHNPYQGLNAHHLSLLQNVGGDWRSFHACYLVHLWEFISRYLSDSYLARVQESIQGLALEATFIDPEDELAAVLIYDIRGKNLLGQPVCRIELLSPANKPPQSHHLSYLAKREETLRSGVALIELDYLHQQASVLADFAHLGLASYPQAGSYPYTILVNDPYPSPEESILQVFGFGVDEVPPLIPIPLAQGEKLPFDFGAVYQHSFSLDRYVHMALDYEQPPSKFERYHPQDQAKILALMARLAAS
jgi:hypothetical protein